MSDKCNMCKCYVEDGNCPCHFVNDDELCDFSFELINIAEHDKQIKSDLIEEIIDKIMQEDYCDKSCCCDNARDCRVNCAEYHHNISAIIGMLINMRVEQTK